METLYVLFSARKWQELFSSHQEKSGLHDISPMSEHTLVMAHNHADNHVYMARWSVDHSEVRQSFELLQTKGCVTDDLQVPSFSRLELSGGRWEPLPPCPADAHADALPYAELSVVPVSLVAAGDDDLMFCGRYASRGIVLGSVLPVTFIYNTRTR